MFEEVKKELITHLYGIDKSKLSIYDLKVYAETVRIVDEIERSNKPDKWMELLGVMNSSFSTRPPYNAVEMKVVE